MEQEYQRHFKRMHWYVLILAVVILGLFWSLYRSKNPSSKPNSTIEQQKIRGSMEVVSMDLSKTSYKVGEKIGLNIVADSDKADVVGFDILLQYDNIKFSRPEVTTSIPGYQVFSNINADHLTMTGVQSPNSNVKTTFDKTPIVSIVLIPQQKGNFSFTIKQRIDKETTKMVDSKTQVLQPSLSGITVKVD